MLNIKNKYTFLVLTEIALKLEAFGSKKLSYLFQLPTMVSIVKLCTPITNKSICFHKNHSCFNILDQLSNDHLPLPSPDVSTQSCQSIFTPALMSPKHRRIANEICDFINLYQLMEEDNIAVLSLILEKLNLP